MGRFRSREVEVVLDHGQEMRIADAPVSEAIKNLTITIAPSTGGHLLPAGAGNLIYRPYYGGGYDGVAKTFAAPTYDTGVPQAAAANLAGGSAIPQQLFLDPDHLPGDRWRDGTTVRENPGLARAIHLRNNIGAASATLVCKIIITTETVSEAT